MESDQEWKQYKNDFNKQYGNKEEEIKRYEAFLNNKKLIEEHNAKFEKGETTFTMGINMFADRLPNEKFC